jgi:hypothetical protein
MVAVGFAMVILVIQALILAVIYTALPDLYYPLEVLIGPPGEFQAAYQVISDAIASVTLVSAILQVAIYVWTITLGTFIARAVTEFGWGKSLLISGGSLLLTVIILSLLLGI